MEPLAADEIGIENFLLLAMLDVALKFREGLLGLLPITSVTIFPHAETCLYDPVLFIEYIGEVLLYENREKKVQSTFANT